ncbi:hypothetical protein AB0I99_13285 [Streptomyces spongiicola]|uniref:hypothetical protein n=1 Tax=Streptomyces spongiicola TaxID=1690221 RepID=UPI0033DA2C26
MNGEHEESQSDHTTQPGSRREAESATCAATRQERRRIEHTRSVARALCRYYDTHDVPKSQDGKGGYTDGTNTAQRNLRALFAYLAEEHDAVDPYLDPKLRRYATPPIGKPKTLSEEFIADCLRTTARGPGRKDFETVRDHALLRVLTEGLRAEEILSLRTFDLDLHAAMLVVVPLKMDRNTQDSRPIPLQPSTVRALQRYLPVRATHKGAGTERRRLAVARDGEQVSTPVRGS